MLDGTEFEVLTESPKENDKFYVVKKKDIWEGVEFITVKESNYFVTEGVIYPIIEKLENNIFTIRNNQGDNGGLVHVSHAKPSTESAYIEQQKRIAKEKFGEIKEGDRFKRDFDVTIDEICTIGECKNTLEFKYFKSNDSLEFCGSIIYQQGKWAEKLPKRVKVEFDGFGLTNDGFKAYWRIAKFETVKDKDDLFEYLSQQLEQYINKQL